MLDNIERVEKYVEENKDSKYAPSQSLILGELKHRAVALKNRLVIINKLNTRKLF